MKTTEEKLWVHVLTRNLLDSLGMTDPQVDVASWLLQQRAKTWINSNDFICICELIDLNPDYAIQIYEKVKKTARHFTQDENQRHLITYLSR